MTRDYPYTADDLRRIADQVEQITTAIGDPEGVGDWRWGVTVDVFDEDGVTPLGQMRIHDEWLGFYPKALIEEDNA